MPTFVVSYDLPAPGENCDLLWAELTRLQARRLMLSHYENSPLLHHLWEHLSAFGYTLYNMYELVVARNGQLRFADVIFVHRDLRTRTLDTYPEEP